MAMRIHNNHKGETFQLTKMEAELVEFVATQMHKTAVRFQPGRLLEYVDLARQAREGSLKLHSAESAYVFLRIVEECSTYVRRGEGSSDFDTAAAQDTLRCLEQKKIRIHHMCNEANWVHPKAARHGFRPVKDVLGVVASSHVERRLRAENPKHMFVLERLIEDEGTDRWACERVISIRPHSRNEDWAEVAEKQLGELFEFCWDKEVLGHCYRFHLVDPDGLGLTFDSRQCRSMGLHLRWTLELVMSETLVLRAVWDFFGKYVEADEFGDFSLLDVPENIRRFAYTGTRIGVVNAC